MFRAPWRVRARGPPPSTLQAMAPARGPRSFLSMNSFNLSVNPIDLPKHIVHYVVMNRLSKPNERRSSVPRRGQQHSLHDPDHRALDQHRHEAARGPRTACEALPDEHCATFPPLGSSATRSGRSATRRNGTFPTSAGRVGIGDVWTWVALDPDTKLVVPWLVGERDAVELPRRS